MVPAAAAADKRGHRVTYARDDPVLEGHGGERCTPLEVYGILPYAGTIRPANRRPQLQRTLDSAFTRGKRLGDARPLLHYC